MVAAHPYPARIPPKEVAGYAPSERVTVRRIEDGDRDLEPHKSSGRTHPTNLADTIGALAAFACGL